MSFNNPCIERKGGKEKPKHCSMPSIYLSFISIPYPLKGPPQHLIQRNQLASGAQYCGVPTKVFAKEEPSHNSELESLRWRVSQQSQENIPSTKNDSAIHQQETWMLWSQQNPSLYIYIYIYLHLLKQLFHILSPITGLKGECGTILGLKHPMRCAWEP